VTSVKAKRYYFGTIKINTSRVTLSMCTSKLTPELRSIRTSVTSGILASFEDAKVDLGQICFIFDYIGHKVKGQGQIKLIYLFFAVISWFLNYPNLMFFSC